MIIEIIPYTDFKERIDIVSQELDKNRHIEVWDGYIYSETKRGKRRNDNVSSNNHYSSSSNSSN